MEAIGGDGLCSVPTYSAGLLILTETEAQLTGRERERERQRQQHQQSLPLNHDNKHKMNLMPYNKLIQKVYKVHTKCYGSTVLSLYTM